MPSDDRLPEHLQDLTMDALRDLTIESVINHMDMDDSFMRAVAERYVEAMSDEDVISWHEEI